MTIRSDTAMHGHPFRLPTRFFKATSILVLGTAVAQLIQLLGFPIIVRIYSPEMIAAYAVVLSVVLPLSVISTGVYEQATMLPKTDFGASVVQRLCFVLSLAVNLAAGVVIFFARDFLDSRMSVSLGAMWLLVPVASFLLMNMKILTAYANRNKWYVVMSVARVSRVIGMLTVQIGFGLGLGIGVLGLVIGDVVGSLIAGLLLALLIRDKRSPLRRASRRYSARRLAVVAKTYSQFPKVSMLRGLAVELKTTIIVFFIGATFSAAELGAYYLMLRVISIPSLLIGQAVGQVYYREATSAFQKSGRFDHLTTQVVVLLLLAGSLFGVILWVAGPTLFELVFGEQWRIAGEYARNISYLVVFTFVLAPLSPFASIVAGRQRTAFLLAIVQEVIFVVAFVVGAKITSSVEGALSVAAVPTAIYTAWFVYWNIQISRKGR